MAELIPIIYGEILDPAEQRSVNSIARQTAMGLTPMQQARLAIRAGKKRGETVIALLDLEREAVLAEARITVRGHLARRGEEQALQTFKTRLDCLKQAAWYHEDTLQETVRLSEDTRAIFGNAVNATALRYARGVERREGKV